MIDNHIVVHEPTFTITDIKPFAPVVILSTQDNAKLLEQFKSSFKRTINRNKYEPQVAVQEQNWYLDFLVTPSFQEVNRLFVLSFQYTNCRIILFHLLKKECNILIYGGNLLDKPMKNNLVTYDNITAYQWDDYTTGCCL